MVSGEVDRSSLEKRTCMNPGWHYLSAERLCVVNEHLLTQPQQQALLVVQETISLQAVWVILALGLKMLG